MVKVRDRNETRRKKYPDKTVETFSESRRWTRKEKEQLLRALYKHGHLDVAKLQSEIPTRSQGSIRSAIAQYKKEARKLLNKDTKAIVARRIFDEDVLKEIKSPMLQNTESWMAILKNVLEDKSSIQYVLSNIFLIIAEVGDFPPSELCDDVDFREVYMCMHGIMNGYPCKEVSMKTAAYMFDCFNRMQVASNRLGHDRERKFLEETYGCSVPSTRASYPKKSKTNSQFSNINFTILERMLEGPDANPLKVPMELLVKQRK